MHMKHPEQSDWGSNSEKGERRLNQSKSLFKLKRTKTISLASIPRESSHLVCS